MVEKEGEGAKRQVYAADWAAIFQRWRAGEDEVVLAKAFDIRPDTVKSRCRWIDKAFPRLGRLQMQASLTARLEEAEAVLVKGQALEAERRAKAVFALIRAARALETWMRDDAKPGPNGMTPEEEELSDYEVSKAELERRLLRLIDFEERRQKSADAAQRGEAEPRRDDTPGLDLGGVGETGSDPA
jgi:hypothetical protein